MPDETSRLHLPQAETPTLKDGAYEFPMTIKGTGKTMSMRTKAAVRETAQDVLIISAFGFWATILGFMPVVAIHSLFG